MLPSNSRLASGTLLFSRIFSGLVDHPESARIISALARWPRTSHFPPVNLENKDSFPNCINGVYTTFMRIIKIIAYTHTYVTTKYTYTHICNKIVRLFIYFVIKLFIQIRCYVKMRFETCINNLIIKIRDTFIRKLCRTFAYYFYPRLSGLVINICKQG